MDTHIHHPDDIVAVDTPLVVAIRRDKIELATLDIDGVSTVGTFTSAADAWSALDEIDCPLETLAVS